MTLTSNDSGQLKGTISTKNGLESYCRVSCPPPILAGELFNSMVVDLCLPFCCFGNVAEASLRTESLEIWFPQPSSSSTSPVLNTLFPQPPLINTSLPHPFPSSTPSCLNTWCPQPSVPGQLSSYLFINPSLPRSLPSSTPGLLNSPSRRALPQHLVSSTCVAHVGK